MPRNIKISLTLNDKTVTNLKEFKENFDIELLIYYFSTGGLFKFLKSRGYNDFATKILIIKKDDKNLPQKLYNIFEVPAPPAEELQKLNVQKIILRYNKKDRLKLYTDDEEILNKAENVAFNQQDLKELIDSGISEIYLCSGKFTISPAVRNKIYIGVGEVVAVIDSEKLVDFDALNIEFQKIIFDDNYEKIRTSPAAMNELGETYYDLEDYNKAVEWYEKAAKAGNADAMNNLGVCYRCGCGVTKDYKKAVEWYEKGAKAGSAKAMCNLGVCYENGCGVAQDYKKAFEWYEKGANAGNAVSMYNLGLCYRYGRGVTQDYKKAVEWYEKAAKAGYADAMCNLGGCYHYGYGVIQDYKKAVEWYEKGAKAGSARAMCNLGVCYHYGYGVNKDIEKAKFFYKKAADAGDEDAKKKLAELG